MSPPPYGNILHSGLKGPLSFLHRTLQVFILHLILKACLSTTSWMMAPAAWFLYTVSVLALMRMSAIRGAFVSIHLRKESQECKESEEKERERRTRSPETGSFFVRMCHVYRCMYVLVHIMCERVMYTGACVCRYTVCVKCHAHRCMCV